MTSRDPTVTEFEVHTAAWNIQVWISWIVAMVATLGGTILMPASGWVKGFLLMGQLFLVASTFTLAKTTRDNAEAQKLRNRITKAKTERLLKEFELSEPST